MSISLSTLSATVDGILSADNNELSSLRRQDLIKAALELYSHDAPDEITTDVTGDAGKYYPIATSLTSFVEGFSRIISIEYPAATVASDEAPVYLDPEDWDDDYWAASVRYLWLPSHAPAATEKMRIRFTAPYVISAGAVDIPTAHFYTISVLAAGLCAQAIADKYSRTSDSPLSIDSVDHLSRAQEWSRRARELIGMYKELMGLGGNTDGSSVQGAGEFVDWDNAPSWPLNRRYLFHGSETR
jgi:hypothetical protein